MIEARLKKDVISEDILEVILDHGAPTNTCIELVDALKNHGAWLPVSRFDDKFVYLETFLEIKDVGVLAEHVELVQND